MKVIKRDGSVVEYNALKIVSALEKANKEVREEERILKKDIRRIIRYIEKLDKKRILVEDIQDIIEMKLMEFGKYTLAKKYIVYRYNRALVRKQNTTDASILSLIKNKEATVSFENPNKNARLVSSQRDLIAGEVSKDLTKRILLPENIVTAHEKGILYFHNADYFLQPIFNSSFIDIKDMLENGTVMNYKQIKSPKSFSVACNIMTQIIASTSSSQYGGQTISVASLGKFLHISKQRFQEELKDSGLLKAELDKISKQRIAAEVEVGVQTIEYQINTLMTANGQSPPLTLLLEIEEDSYPQETAQIIEEILKRRLKGMKNEKGEDIIPTFPKLVYVLIENNTGSGKYANLTSLALACAKKQSGFRFLSKKVALEEYKKDVVLMGNNHFLFTKERKGCLNEGVVTLNLPQIAFLSNKNEEEFFTILKERLELCVDTLLRRHYALLGTSSIVSPLHYEYGAIARIGHDTKVDVLLKEGTATLSLGYIGLKETTEYMRGSSLYEKVGKSFALKILKTMHHFLEKAREQYHLDFVLYATESDKVASYFYNLDKMYHLGNMQKYTLGFGYSQEYSYIERLKVEKELQLLSNGGSVSKVLMDEIIDEKEFIETIYHTSLYVEVRNEGENL